MTTDAASADLPDLSTPETRRSLLMDSTPEQFVRKLERLVTRAMEISPELREIMTWSPHCRVFLPPIGLEVARRFGVGRDIAAMIRAGRASWYRGLIDLPAVDVVRTTEPVWWRLLRAVYLLTMPDPPQSLHLRLCQYVFSNHQLPPGRLLYPAAEAEPMPEAEAEAGAGAEETADPAMAEQQPDDSFNDDDMPVMGTGEEWYWREANDDADHPAPAGADHFPYEVNEFPMYTARRLLTLELETIGARVPCLMIAIDDLRMMRELVGWLRRTTTTTVRDLKLCIYLAAPARTDLSAPFICSQLMELISLLPRSMPHLEHLDIHSDHFPRTRLLPIPAFDAAQLPPITTLTLSGSSCALVSLWASSPHVGCLKSIYIIPFGRKRGDEIAPFMGKLLGRMMVARRSQTTPRPISASFNTTDPVALVMATAADVWDASGAVGFPLPLTELTFDLESAGQVDALMADLGGVLGRCSELEALVFSSVMTNNEKLWPQLNAFLTADRFPRLRRLCIEDQSFSERTPRWAGYWDAFRSSLEEIMARFGPQLLDLKLTLWQNPDLATLHALTHAPRLRRLKLGFGDTTFVPPDFMIPAGITFTDRLFATLAGMLDLETFDLTIDEQDRNGQVVIDPFHIDVESFLSGIRLLHPLLRLSSFNCDFNRSYPSKQVVGAALEETMRDFRRTRLASTADRAHWRMMRTEIERYQEQRLMKISPPVVQSSTIYRLPSRVLRMIEDMAGTESYVELTVTAS